MKNIKFVEDCKYPFKVTCKFKMYGMRGCEIDLKSGRSLTYMPIPEGVRYSFTSIEQFYKTSDGQKLIEERLK